jgi:hypothetical protein
MSSAASFAGCFFLSVSITRVPHVIPFFNRLVNKVSNSVSVINTPTIEKYHYET